MDSSGRLYAQVAAEAGCDPQDAMIAVYLRDLSRDNRTLDEAARLLRKQRGEVRNYARDWGVNFSDYIPAAQPLQLVWRKIKRGSWGLYLGDDQVGEGCSDGEGGYYAQLCDESAKVHEAVGSSYLVAFKRLSLIIDRESVSIFGVDDIVIDLEVVTKDGEEQVTHTRLAPKEPDVEPAVMRRALAA